MRIFVCAAVCVLAVAVNAASAEGQDAPGGQAARGVEFGVKAGITSATLSVSGLPGFEPDAGIGMLGGAWVSAGRDTLRLQMELTFGTRRFSSASPIGDIKVSSRALDVPVFVVGRWRPNSRTRPLLFAGPYVSFISGSTQTIGSTRADIDDQIKGADAGVAIGAGLEIGAGRGAAVLDVRYALGMRDLSEASETTFKSRALMVSFGYRF
jgi:hypothetical protein